MNKPQNKIFIALAFFAIYVIWGSTYFLNKIAVTELPAFMLASIRFIVSSLIIFSIAKTLKIPIKINDKNIFWKRIHTLNHGISYFTLSAC